MFNAICDHNTWQLVQMIHYLDVQLFHIDRRYDHRSQVSNPLFRHQIQSYDFSLKKLGSFMFLVFQQSKPLAISKFLLFRILSNYLLDVDKLVVHSLAVLLPSCFLVVMGLILSSLQQVVIKLTLQSIF